ncbi:hypothetical protein [Aestuariivirga sp.]|uniref:hypothetical protein n=1 Tax=Aestuariivirga sp. TaxID=2650926 RepID=UPI00391D7479
MGKDSGEARSTVIRAINLLCETGHMEKRLAVPKRGGRKVNHYRFVTEPDGGTSTSPKTDTSKRQGTSAKSDTSGNGCSPKFDTPTGPKTDTPTSTKFGTQNLLREPLREPLKGAVLKAPAPLQEDTPPLPPMEPLALRAPEGLRAGAGEAGDPDELLEIIEDAELDAYENPGLSRPDYVPLPLSREEAARFLSSRPRSAYYRERAAKLRRAAQAAHPEIRRRADEARSVLLAHAALIDHAAKIASAGIAKAPTPRLRTGRPLPSRVQEDEVPF